MFIYTLLLFVTCLLSYQIGREVEKRANRQYTYYWLGRYLELLGNEPLTHEDAEELKKGDTHV